MALQDEDVKKLIVMWKEIERQRNRHKNREI